MTVPLRFRNLDIDPNSPVDHWGFEGLSSAIERGNLDDWRRIVNEIRHTPYGAVASDLDDALSVANGKGGAPFLARALSDARTGPGATVARRMRHDVRRTGLTLRQFAAFLGTSHSRLSTYLAGSVTPSAAIAVKSARLGAEHRI